MYDADPQAAAAATTPQPNKAARPQSTGRLADDVAELRRHLARTPPSLPCKYFYDTHGSALFEQITVQPEYYPTRTETALLRREAPALLRRLGAVEIAEIGAGAGFKTELLIEAGRAAGTLERVVVFDVAAEFLQTSASRLRSRWPGVTVRAVVGDFTQNLDRLGTGGRRLLVFLGGTIGNLDPSECTVFLGDVARLLGPDDALLLGVDLIKSAARLEAAYDDAAGVTAAFNLNILQVINARFGADFARADFTHVSVWNAAMARIEMRLRTTRAVSVRIEALDTTLELLAGADLLTELSCKYSKPLLTERLDGAGLHLSQWMTDDDGLFGLALITKEPTK